MCCYCRLPLRHCLEDCDRLPAAQSAQSAHESAHESAHDTHRAPVLNQERARREARAQWRSLVCWQVARAQGNVQEEVLLVFFETGACARVLFADIQLQPVVAIIISRVPAHACVVQVSVCARITCMRKHEKQQCTPESPQLRVDVRLIKCSVVEGCFDLEYDDWVLVVLECL